MTACSNLKKQFIDANKVAKSSLWQTNACSTRSTFSLLLGAVSSRTSQQLRSSSMRTVLQLSVPYQLSVAPSWISQDQSRLKATISFNFLKSSRSFQQINSLFCLTMRAFTEWRRCRNLLMTMISALCITCLTVLTSMVLSYIGELLRRSSRRRCWINFWA